MMTNRRRVQLPHVIRAPALPSVLLEAMTSTDGKAGARMKTDAATSSQDNKKSGNRSTSQCQPRAV
jgi:hypothetical protein